VNNQIESCTLESALKEKHTINLDLLRISDILST